MTCKRTPPTILYSPPQDVEHWVRSVGTVEPFDLPVPRLVALGVPLTLARVTPRANHVLSMIPKSPAAPLWATANPAKPRGKCMLGLTVQIPGSNLQPSTAAMTAAPRYVDLGLGRIDIGARAGETRETLGETAGRRGGGHGGGRRGGDGTAGGRSCARTVLRARRSAPMLCPCRPSARWRAAVV